MQNVVWQSIALFFVFALTLLVLIIL